MIVGDGLIASHLIDVPGCVLHAAGVSNPTCTDPAEYARDIERLRESLAQPGRLVYVSTTSQADSDYVRHKREAERIVLRRGGSVVVRIPTIAARSDNPHTLLNWLWRHISAGESFPLWNGRRNIISVRCAAREIERIANSRSVGVVDVGWSRDYSVLQIVRAMEELAGKRAMFTHQGELQDEPPDDYLRGLLRECYP